MTSNRVSLKEKNIPVEERTKVAISGGSKRICYWCKSAKPVVDFQGKSKAAKCKKCREPGLKARLGSSVGLKEKACTICKQTKEIKEFYIKTKEPYSDGSPRYYSACSQCHYDRYVSAWSAKNYEYYRELIKDWQDANPDKMERYKTRGLEGRELHFFWHHDEARRRCEAVEDSVYYDFTLEDLEKHWNEVGIDKDSCYYQEHNSRCRGKMEHYEHVLPITRGGNHEISNIVPACTSCNSSKYTRNDKEFVSWLKENGRHTSQQ